MPEGDTVYRTAKRLLPLTGEVLTVSDFRIPSLATRDLSGARVLETLSRGKHLLTRVEGGVSVHSHLKMEGLWSVQRAGARWRRPAHQARLVLRTGSHEAVGFAIVLDLLPTAEEDRVVGHLGPDLLGPGWDPDEAARRLAADPASPLGDALLEQRHLAGVGNVFKAEICFLAGLHPLTPVGAVPDLPHVVDLAHRLLAANRDRVERVTTGDPRSGFRYWVYGRRGPCLRCGTRVARDDQGPRGRERVTYWCPRCQPPGPIRRDQGRPGPG